MFSLMGAAQVVGLPLGSWLGSRFEKKHVIVGGLLITPRRRRDRRRRHRGLLPRAARARHAEGRVRNRALGAFGARRCRRRRAASDGDHAACSDVVGLGAPVALGLLADSTSCGAAIGSSAITMTGCTL